MNKQTNKQEWSCNSNVGSLLLHASGTSSTLVAPPNTYLEINIIKANIKRKTSVGFRKNLKIEAVKEENTKKFIVKYKYLTTERLTKSQG